MRSRVDLPQPDGPTMTTISPSAMSQATPWSTSVDPKDLRTSRRRDLGHYFSLSTRPLTNQRCISTTTATGGSMASSVGRHHDVPFGLRVAVADHLSDADDDRRHRRRVGDEQRPEILVPAIDEQDDEQRRDVGARQRHHRVPEEAQRPGAVDLAPPRPARRGWSGRTGGTAASRWPRRSAGWSARHRCRSGRGRRRSCRSG